jgi:hypothetical protein
MTMTTALLALVVANQAYSDSVTMSGNTANEIVKTNVEAGVGTTLTFYPMSANKEGKDKGQPFPFDGVWTFTWNSDTPDKVDFTGVANFGNHFTVTDAGSLGGTTRQTFHEFQHHFKGTATWDAATNTLSYQVKPKERDAGGASTVTESAPADCDKISGFTAGKACSAFKATSPPLEGLTLNLKFAADKSSFDGKAVFIQFGGSGMTKSETNLDVNMAGTLAAQ